MRNEEQEIQQGSLFSRQSNQKKNSIQSINIVCHCNALLRVLFDFCSFAGLCVCVQTILCDSSH